MPHQFMTITCENCNTAYCVVCNDVCPECRKEPNIDQEKKTIRDKMRKHMSSKHIGH